MKREFVDFSKAKKGDIIVLFGYDGSLGNIIMFDNADDGYIHFLCQFDIGNNSFSVNNYSNLHFGKTDEDRDEFKAVKPTESEEVLMGIILDKYGYYFDEDINQLVQEGMPEVGHPEITWDDVINHEMKIKGLNGIQRNIIHELIRRWK